MPRAARPEDRHLEETRRVMEARTGGGGGRERPREEKGTVLCFLICKHPVNRIFSSFERGMRLTCSDQMNGTGKKWLFAAPQETQGGVKIMKDSAKIIGENKEFMDYHMVRFWGFEVVNEIGFKGLLV